MPKTRSLKNQRITDERRRPAFRPVLAGLLAVLLSYSSAFAASAAGGGVGGGGGGGGRVAPLDVLVPLGLLILVLVLFGAAWKFTRDRIRDGGGGEGGGSAHEAGGLLVERMREMVRRGELSEAEFESARAAWRRAAVREKEKFLGVKGDPAGGGGDGLGDGKGKGGGSENSGGGVGRRRVGVDGTVRAVPGYDLTGQPLPKPGRGGGEAGAGGGGGSA